MLKLGILANRSVEKLILAGVRITCEGLHLLIVLIMLVRYSQCIATCITYILYSNIIILYLGAIALAEVLAESRYLTHVDLRENEIRIAGLMALSLALRMNHKLLHLETPKTFKVDQVREKRRRGEFK